jgi:8-oxoguanine deaminase
MTARDALDMATRGGAQVLGRTRHRPPGPGHVPPTWRCSTCAPWALPAVRCTTRWPALLLCASPQAAYTVVNGRVVVREGQLATVELGPLLERHNRLAPADTLTAQRT